MSKERSESGPAPDQEHNLVVERTIEAAPEAVFDAFLELYGDNRPDWIVESELDLRVGGSWRVTFHPPGIEPFREERVITELDPPRRLGYTMTAIPSDDRPSFRTTVVLTLSEQGASTHVMLSQRGFPTVETRDDFASAWPDVLELVGRTASRPA